MLSTSQNISKMEQQLPPTVQLPYEPIKFVYTETIGSLEEKFREIIDPYTWTYEDLLQPKILYSKSKIQYYLFHIAPIYNWLRHVGSSILAQYIQTIDSKSSTNLNSKSLTFTKPLSSQQQSFSQQTFMFQLKHYISQWEIVKLCATAKIKIITTRTQAKKTQTKPVKSQTQGDGQLLCTHLIKKDKFTTDYVLNTLESPDKPKLQCSSVYCAQCQKNVPIKADIIKYPFAPFFNKYHGKQFTLVTNPSTTITYLLVIIYSPQKVYMKSSAGVWYEISAKENKKNIVSFERIDTKSGLVFVYHQQVKAKADKVLRKAQPVKVEEFKKQEKALVDLSKFISKQDKDSDDDDDDANKILNRNSIIPAKSASTLSSKPQPASSLNQQTILSTPQPQQIEGEDDQPLEDMSKTPLPIIMNKKKTQRKLFKEYKKTVQSLLPKQKEKDQYEKQYDKGKTKKIHKNRQQFRTADFFSLYNKLKGGNGNHTNNSNKHQDITDNNEDGDNRMRDNQNNDQENYNEVYRDKRNDRFGQRGGFRGRGGSRGRGGMHGDRRSGGRDGNYRGGGQGGRGSRGGRGGRGGFKSYNNNRNGGGSHGNFKSKGNFHNKSSGHKKSYDN